VDDLDRDRPPEGLLLSPVDAAHAPDPDELEDHIAAGQGGADEGVVAAALELRDREAADGTKLVSLLARVSTLRADDFGHRWHPTTVNCGL
jgi:hypothetical protein